VVGEPVDEPAFTAWCTEASVPPPPGLSYLDSQLGAAVRRWCPPVLDLPPHAPVPAYLDRRAELGVVEVNRRLLTAAGLSALLVDTGLRGEAVPVQGLPAAPLVSPEALGDAASAEVAEVVRLEYLAQRLAADGATAEGFGSAFADALAAEVAHAVAVKSVLAYRHGLDIEPDRPSAAEVRAAAGAWLRSRAKPWGGWPGRQPGDAGNLRLTDPVLLRYLLWCAVDVGLPIQLHTGFGDRDLALARSDPALLQRFCAATEPAGVPLVLLHCYPYHRQAGWLAQVYPHVHVDVGLTVTHLGVRATDVLGEFFELAPFGKLMYSSDAFGLPELYLVAAAQFRHGLGRLLDRWVADGGLDVAQALGLADLVGADNARRVYRLGSG
jgi:predicted TIM-barrel fold metal-dependent hydrolase